MTDAADKTHPYPPRMPWRLRARGPVLASLHWVEAQRARQLLPPELTLVQPLPGRTLGGIFLAEYGPGSELQYHELIVAAATVWYEGRPALWITDLFVDRAASVQGGRELLGAPKRLAPFARAEGGTRVGDPSAPVCRVRHRPWLPLWRQRVRMAAMHFDVRDPTGSTVAWHGEEMRGRWGLARVEVEIPPTSPLRQVGLGAQLLGLRGQDVELTLGGAPFLPLRQLPVSPDPPR